MLRRRLGPVPARELTLTVVLLLFAAAVAVPAAKGRGELPPSARMIPWVAAPATYGELLAPELLPPDRAATAIKSAVSLADPLLLPTAIPAGSDAYVAANASSFQIDYLSRSAAQRVVIKIGAQTPPLGPHASASTKSFRGVAARYGIDEPADPGSYRYLAWTQPGTWKGQSTAGVPYFLSATGFTDAQFWQLVNSLAPVLWPAAPRLCEPADLDIRLGFAGAATHGQLIHSLGLGNRSATPCSVQGTPRLALTLPDGTAVANRQIDGNPMPPGRVAGPVTLQPGLPPPLPQQLSIGHGWVVFQWTFCPGPAPVVSSIRLDLPNGGGTVAVSGVPAGGRGLSSSGCDSPEQGHVLLVGPFQPAPLDIPVQRPPLQLSISLKVTASAVLGQPLRYEVALTNVSGAPFHFDTCPSYREALDWPRKEWAADYELNCAPVGTLAPGAGATLAMVLDIPETAPTGRHELTWAFHPFSDLFVPVPVVGSPDADGHGTAGVTISSR